ncbi:hypothetical protein [Streptomyces sp. SID14515]|uniref:hypothetical protein n=1 Tax=Streptomyces sp. SID14515 TaxID=2706074 RepID=UPI0013CCB40C|nr:hypothetical protein [Streptomyces sp. SID14515]NEB38905.1 hypothetical protein [Streptomyces sp. SID14515]
MSEQDDVARPGIAPTSCRTAGTMFAALYGEFVPHAWHDPESEHDAYQLFLQRSLAMGWLDDRSSAVPGAAPEKRTIVAPGLWAMNDAGWSHPLAAPSSKLISWFQVEASEVASDRPLPVQPFLRCAQDTTERIGAVQLDAVQVLLPVQGVDASTRPAYAVVPSMQTPDWFGACDPRSRASVRIRIDSGRTPSVPAVASQLTRNLSRLDQGVFVGAADQRIPLDSFPTPPFDDRFWGGPPMHGIVLSGELAEWSCDAVGWLAETVADSAAHLGIRSPLLFTVARA